MAKEKVKTDYEIAVEDFENAVRERNRARQMFDYATADYFEIACEELKASELKVSICQKKVRQLAKEEDSHEEENLSLWASIVAWFKRLWMSLRDA